MISENINGSERITPDALDKLYRQLSSALVLSPLSSVELQPDNDEHTPTTPHIFNRRLPADQVQGLIEYENKPKLVQSAEISFIEAHTESGTYLPACVMVTVISTITEGGGNGDQGSILTNCETTYILSGMEDEETSDGSVMTECTSHIVEPDTLSDEDLARLELLIDNMKDMDQMRSLLPLDVQFLRRVLPLI